MSNDYFDGDTLKVVIAHLQSMADQLNKKLENIKHEILEKASYLQVEQMLYEEIALPENRSLLVNYSEKRDIKMLMTGKKTLPNCRKKSWYQKVQNRLSVTLACRHRFIAFEEWVIY